MAENTKIAWATHTFNPWIGCSRVHAGCANCYAEAMAGRLGVTWGTNGTRRRTAESTWRQVEKWSRQASGAMCVVCRGQGHGGDEAAPCRYCAGSGRVIERPRVFPSLCDPFEDWRGPVADWQRGVTTMDTVREDFFSLIDHCQNLDWLLLTKRPENIRRMWPRAIVDAVIPSCVDGERYRTNVWLLYSASDQASLEAGLPHLLACRDLAPVLGLSLEPLIGPVDLGRMVHFKPGYSAPAFQATNMGRRHIDWVIVGGESGPRARPCNVEWIRSIVLQCASANVPCFVKQLGSNCVEVVNHGEQIRHKFSDAKGGDTGEWPSDLRVRRFPAT